MMVGKKSVLPLNPIVIYLHSSYSFDHTSPYLNLLLESNIFDIFWHVYFPFIYVTNKYLSGLGHYVWGIRSNLKPQGPRKWSYNLHRRAPLQGQRSHPTKSLCLTSQAAVASSFAPTGLPHFCLYHSLPVSTS